MENKITTVRKTFNESVIEIRQYEQNLKEVIPRPPSEEAGKPIEMITLSFGEAVAEIDRIQLVKRLSTRVRKGVKSV